MSFLDRFSKKGRENNKDVPKNEVKAEKKKKDAAWATSKEKPVEKQEEKPVEEQVETKEEEPSAKPQKKPAKKSEGEPKTTEKKKTETKKDTKTWHITKRNEDGMWQVKAEGNTKATKLFKTKAEAEDYVKTLRANNKGSKIVKHKKTGEFQKK